MSRAAYLGYTSDYYLLDYTLSPGDHVTLSCLSPRPWLLCSWVSPPPRMMKQCALRLGQGLSSGLSQTGLCSGDSVANKLPSR